MIVVISSHYREATERGGKFLTAAALFIAAEHEELVLNKTSSERAYERSIGQEVRRDSQHQTLRDLE